MIYSINGLVIHSDRAALPSGRISTTLLNALERTNAEGLCVDYGCGKLRHLDEIRNRFTKLTLIDSNEQLTKRQTIHGTCTTIFDYCRQLEKVKVFAVEEQKKCTIRHDWALCINVLSAIPCAESRIEALKNINRLLKTEGQLLLVTQLRNSRFSKFSEGKRLLDGHVHCSRKGLHFFGLIPLKSIVEYLSKAGFNVTEVRKPDGYLYVTAIKDIRRL